MGFQVISELLSSDYKNKTGQEYSLVNIISVKCPNCSRMFRTVPSVLEHSGGMYCPKCGIRMEVSDPEPISSIRIRKPA
jgi:DNA-directed RNA polymerase subunit RPC12/RpoP